MLNRRSSVLGRRTERGKRGVIFKIFVGPGHLEFLLTVARI